MCEFVEPRVRRLVAEHLAVGLEELVSAASLRDDLAANELDLVRLAMALEGEFAIGVPERLLDEVRTYSELVHATGLLIRARCKAETDGPEPPDHVLARIVPPVGGSRGILERTDWLTPYTAETIAEDAVRAGSGAKLELAVGASTAQGIARVEHRFARLGRRGVQVTVRRDQRSVVQPVQGVPEPVAEPFKVAATGALPASTDPSPGRLPRVASP